MSYFGAFERHLKYLLEMKYIFVVYIWRLEVTNPCLKTQLDFMYSSNILDAQFHLNPKPAH